MAKIGLNYGDKLQIADKSYRVITEGLDIPEVLGKLTFRGIEGADLIYEEDRTQRNDDGSFAQTYEELWLVSTLLSNTKHFSLPLLT